MIRTCILALALGAIATTPAILAGAAETPTWDQAAATAAAQSLEQTVNEIRKSIKLEDGAIQARQNKTFVVAEDLRTLERFSRRLSNQLAAGASREDTEPLFTRAMRVVDRLRVNMPGTPSFANEIDKIDTARAQLEVLAPMYGVTLPPPVAAPAQGN